MDLYTREEIADQKKKKEGFRLAAMIISSLALIAVIIMLCLSRPLTVKPLNIAAAVVAALAGCFDIYVASFIMPYMQPKPKYRGAAGKALKVLSNILHQLHMYAIWIILSAIIVSFAFNQTTDTVPGKKVEIYADAAALDAPHLETLLDVELPEGIKMVKVRQIDYELFGLSDPAAVDIYLIPESSIEEHLEFLAPLGEFYDAQSIPSDAWQSGGAAYGLLALPAGGLPSTGYLTLSSSEAYYICFGANGLHKGIGAPAAQTAQKLLEIIN